MTIIKTRDDHLLAYDRSKIAIAPVILLDAAHLCDANAALRGAVDAGPCRRYAAGAADSRNAICSLE